MSLNLAELPKLFIENIPQTYVVRVKDIHSIYDVMEYLVDVCDHRGIEVSALMPDIGVYLILNSKDYFKSKQLKPENDLKQTELILHEELKIPSVLIMTYSHKINVNSFEFIYTDEKVESLQAYLERLTKLNAML